MATGDGAAQDRIERVDLHVLKVRELASRESKIATMTIDADGFYLVACVVTTTSGTHGNAYGWCVGARRARLIAAAVKETADLLLGYDATAIDAAWDAFWRFSNFLGHSGLAVMGMSVLDMALWDVRCTANDEPLWAVIGGHRDAAAVYSTGLGPHLTNRDPSPSELTDAARGMAADGHTMIKLAVEHPEELDRLREVVETTRGELQWAIDIAQVWDVPTAIRAIDSVEDLQLVWVEDPVPYDDNHAMADVVRSVRTPICSGENAYSVIEPQRLVAETGIRYLSLDLMRCGGITGWRTIASALEGSDVQIVSHTYPQVAAHLVCATEHASFVEQSPIYDGFVGPRIPVRDGRTPAPEAPGIGVEFSQSVYDAAHIRVG